MAIADFGVEERYGIEPSMAENLTFPFWIVEMELLMDGTVVYPLLVPETVWLEETPQQMLDKLGQVLQTHQLEQGRYASILQHTPNIEIEQTRVSVKLVPGKNKTNYTQLILPFDLLYACLDKGAKTAKTGKTADDRSRYLGFVPALGLEACGDTLEELQENVAENIRLEFGRKKKLGDIREILATQWFAKIKPICLSKSLEFYTIHELSEHQARKKKKLLPELAEQPVISQQATFGRTEELSQLQRSFQGQFRNNILLVGQSGCGKSALFYELLRQQARLSWAGHCWETTASRLIQKLTQDVGWQENLSLVCQELHDSGAILFVKNLAELFEVGQYIGNNVSIAEYLREYLQRGQITMVSECTPEEAAQIEIRSPGYLALFQKIKLEEPPADMLQEMVQKKVALIAQEHQVPIANDACEEALRLTRRYTPYSGFPGKAIRFLESLILARRTTKAAVVDRAAVIAHFCQETGMPNFMVDPDLPWDEERVYTFFANNLRGQEEAVRTVVQLLTAIKAGVTRQGKPIASLLFVGPTGVGKTEMAKLLAEFLFGSRDKMIRFDMSEFADLGAVLRFTGDTCREGLLTMAVRQEPFSVILLDELEKAHYSFFDLLLQVLGEGRLTDAQGQLASFCSTVIIMTSNIGTQNYQKGHIGFEDHSDARQICDHFCQEVQNYFRPELFNRLDQVIPFLPLSRTTVDQIVLKELGQVRKREGIQFRKLRWEASPQVNTYLGDHGYDAKYGARQMQRVLRDHLLIPLAAKLNMYKTDLPLEVAIARPKDRLEIQVRGISDKSECDIAAESHEGQMQRLVNQVSIFRREYQRVQAGPFYNKLLSELDILERRKQRHQDKFWKNAAASQSYTVFTNLVRDGTNLLEQIQNIEIELSLDVLGIATGSLELPQKFATWQQAYQNLQLQLYSALTPNANVCTLAIYGPPQHLLQLATMYQDIACQKTYVCQSQSVWFRDSLYREEKKYVRHNYIIPQPPEPEKPDDKLVGFILELSGLCPFLYFCQESRPQDVHVWEDQGKSYYVIQIVNTTLAQYQPPRELHRKQFFQDRIERRLYQTDLFKDKEYKEIRPGGHEWHASQLKEILDQQFAGNLLATIAPKEVFSD